MTGEKELDLDDIERRMKGALDALQHEFAGLRTGRASVSLLEPIKVDAYGSEMPLNQVGTISVPEPRMLNVQVWDKGMVSAVEKAIQNADLGLNPFIDGQTVRVPIPELNEERRREMGKIAAKYAEQARVAVRNVRRDGMDKLKHLEKDEHMSKDEAHVYGEEVQELTDNAIKSIDATLHQKEQDIMEV